MYEVKVSLDKERYDSKPTGNEAAKINYRIGNSVEVLKCPTSVYEFVQKVGQCGYTFSPTTFSNGTKKIDDFEQMQMLVLDFDGGVSYKGIRDRAKQYELPLLAVYDTFSSKEHDRFRAIFLNDVPITDKRAAKIYKSALMAIFPECDHTDSDISKMYYGGKEVLYFDPSVPVIDMESTLMQMTHYLKDKCGDTHYKRELKKFAKKHGIRLNKRGLLDVSIVENPTESIGTSGVGKNREIPIIFYKHNNDFLPKSCYQIHLENECTRGSLENEKTENRNWTPSVGLENIENKCQLFKEFVSGIRLHHHELFGLSTNIIHIKGGMKKFKQILSSHPEHYDSAKQKLWEFYLRYNNEMGYNPQQCNGFCAYRDKCIHGTNILTTVKPRRGSMERDVNYTEAYYTIEEVQEDLRKSLGQVVNADDKRWHIIKAQTSAGKTEAYLTLMRTMDSNFLIVVPTNKLKQDVRKRAEGMGIKLLVTPSLDELESEIPEDIWEHIKFLRETGQHKKVHPYVSKAAEEEGIGCLKKYLEKQKEFETYTGHTVTTHRKFLNMDKKTLDKYDVVIIDEDIILSSIIPNQCEISVSDLKRLMKKAVKENSDPRLVRKIKKAFHAVKSDTLFRLPGFEWEDDGEDTGDAGDTDGISAITDIPSFCLAEHFICRRKDREMNLAEDSIVFLKPYKFKPIKHIMVSATVDKDICEYCFGKENVKFYECKQARYTGTLNQYFEHSMSRRYIDKDTDILNRISAWSGFQHMITFKKYHAGDMYFGNAIGCDYLKGKDIDVVGTPYQVDFLYKLFPFSIGLNIDEDATMKPCRVEHNGYIFIFTTYGKEHDILRKFHLWMIESELEQAVGRARLLRCDCTVNLYSNFPIRQAAMRKSEYDN